MSEKIFFESVKEHLGYYFVEYRPPVAGNQFATLSLVFLDNVAHHKIKEFMELELQRWLKRYSIPLMVSAFDSTDTLIQINKNLKKNHLVGWFIPKKGQIKTSWEHKDLDNFIKNASINLDLLSTYKDIPYKTESQVQVEATRDTKQRSKQMKLLKLLLVTWLSIIPTGIAIYEFWGPAWINIVALIYALWKAFDVGRRIIRRRKLSRTELEKEEKENKKNHYYYHCERNPDAFLRLKAENFEKDIHDSIFEETHKLNKGNKFANR